MIEQTKFYLFSFGKSFKQKKQNKKIEDQGKQQVDALKTLNPK